MNKSPNPKLVHGSWVVDDGWIPPTLGESVKLPKIQVTQNPAIFKRKWEIKFSVMQLLFR